MRLGTFIVCVVAVILACRFCSTWLQKQPSKSEPMQRLVDESSGAAVPLVAKAVDGESPSSQPSEMFGDSYLDSPVPMLVNSALSQESKAQVSRADHLSLSTVDQPNDETGFSQNAKNVKTLFRAQYEIPEDAAELLVQLETDVLLETKLLDSGRPNTTILQVTTDKESQKRISGFLSALYPPDSIESLANRTIEPLKCGQLLAEQVVLASSQGTYLPNCR